MIIKNTDRKCNIYIYLLRLHFVHFSQTTIVQMLVICNNAAGEYNILINLLNKHFIPFCYSMMLLNIDDFETI